MFSVWYRALDGNDNINQAGEDHSTCYGYRPSLTNSFWVNGCNAFSSKTCTCHAMPPQGASLWLLSPLLFLHREWTAPGDLHHGDLHPRPLACVGVSTPCPQHWLEQSLRCEPSVLRACSAPQDLASFPPMPTVGPSSVFFLGNISYHLSTCFWGTLT